MTVFHPSPPPSGGSGFAAEALNWAYSQLRLLGSRLNELWVAEYWDDQRYPATGISVGALSTPPDVESNTGLFLFDSTSAETIAVLAQMSHAKSLGSPINPHVHWRKTTNAAGDVVWGLRYKWWSAGEVEPAWSSTILGTDAIPVDATQKQILTTFGPIDPPATEGLSSLFLAQVGRLPANAGDTYGADALLYEYDIHVKLNSRGSETEFSKFIEG